MILMKHFTLHTNENKWGRHITATVRCSVLFSEIAYRLSSALKEEMDVR